MTIPFLKMQGAANDFVVVDHRAPFLPATDAGLEPLVRRLCDRRRGVGADGVLLLERGRGDVDFAMRYFNADGRPAEFCGNGARCLARLALDLGLGNGGEVRFDTAVGLQRARRGSGHGIDLDFGEVQGAGPTETVEALGRGFTGRRAVTGVPHFVVPVERVEWVPVKEWGSALRHHPAFGPAGTNVDFIARLASGRVAMRTYERGVEDETLACGSGAMASALWVVAEGDSPPIAIVTAGGDELVVGLTPRGSDGARWDVRLTGPAEVVFRGEWTEAAAAVPAGAGSTRGG